MLDFGIDVDVWPWIWLAVAVVFALVELTFIGGTFVLLPFAISAFAAAILAFYDVPVEVEWATFVIGGTALLFVMLRWVRGFLSQSEMPAGVGAERLVGTTGIVTVAIDAADSTRPGRVTIGGEVWGALSSNDETLPIGTRVRIASMIGTRVVVEPISVDDATRSNPADADGKDQL